MTAAVQHYEAAFPGAPETVSAARRFVRQTCTAADLPSELLYDAMTCVSELAANAVRHTASGKPGGSYCVVVEILGSRAAHIEVVDQGGPCRPVLQDCAQADEHGRGLRICAELGVLTLSPAPRAAGWRVGVDLPHPAVPAPHPADGCER